MSGARHPSHLVAPAVGTAVFLGAWEAIVRISDVRPFVMRAPSQILAYLGRAPGDFLTASWTTAWHAVVGFLIAAALSVPIGAVLAASPWLERASQPVLVLIQVTPFAAYISSVVLWLGYGAPPVLFIATLVCLPPFVIAMVAGMRSADPATRELLASVDASAWVVLWRLRLPGAMPAAFTAGRYSIGLALIVAYLVEGSNFADEGLGAIGRRAAANNAADPLWATIFCTAVLGTLGLVAVGALERVVLRWHVSQRRLLP
jgi:NitT/TauT family transport system permease protein